MLKVHMKNPNCYMTLCMRPLFVNVPSLRWYSNRKFVDCKVCLKVLDKGDGLDG